MLRVVYFLGVAVVVRGQREYSGEPDPHWWVAILLLLILILAFIIPFACRHLCFLSRDNGLKPTDRGLAKVAQLARYRQAVRNTHLNEVPPKLPPNGRYLGQIKDTSDAHFADYELHFDEDGTVRGSCRNHQRTCVVRGFYHDAKEMYIWGETDNIHRFDTSESPREVESRIISSNLGDALTADNRCFLDRIFYSEVEARVSDADKGHLFLTFICSTGAKGTFHCKYCPVGHISSEMIS